MQYQEVDPPDALRDAIHKLWYVSRDVDAGHARFEVVPDSYVELIFYVGGPCCRATPDGWQPLRSPFLVGLLPQPALFQAPSRLEIIGVKCFPWAVAELLGGRPGPAGAHWLAHPIAQLQAPLTRWLQAGNVAAAWAQVSQYFEQARPRRPADRTLDQAGRALHAAAGRLPVSQVAAAACTTVRTLERKFKHAAGQPLKDVAGLLRFEQVRRHLWQQPTTSLAGLAQELGYADQSHLGRDFKRYCGTTPAAFARQARHWHQTVSTDFVAFILA